jgi:asparagine synthase (glutamine-hydrolysing)
MSGICGICEPGRKFDSEQIRSMVAALAVDASEKHDAVWSDSIALGVSQRFAGQDLGFAERVWVAADVDLLNLDSLRSEVEIHGQQPPGSAAQVLASLYAIHGVEFIHRLDGAFAFVLWDRVQRRLMLAIDRLGIKNLYWSFAKNRLSFASRASALQTMGAPASADPAALAEFLIFSAVPAPHTVYAGMKKLSPGCLLVLEDGHLRQRQYWDLQFTEEKRGKSEWAGVVREALRASVHRHLANARPETTGAFLSGGTDSSTVVAFMSERWKPVDTFSAVFNESSYSEANFVQSIVERFETRQHSCCLSPGDAMAAIPKIAAYYGEPFANSSAIAAYFCALTASQSGVDLLLGGDGGDELFAGNQRYETDKQFALYHRIPAVLRSLAIEPVVHLLPREHRWLSLPRRYIQRALIPNPRRFFSYNFFLSFPPEDIFEPDFLRQAPCGDWLDVPAEHFARPSNATELNRLLYLDVKLALADNDLKKVSGMAELAGVKVRYPLLDYRLAELAARVPTQLKLRRFEKRYIFKQAMAGILPQTVLYKKKHGMGVPVSSWLLLDPQLRQFVQEVLYDRRTRQRGYFRAGFVERLLSLQRDEHVSYYGEIVWYLLMLELWHRQHVDCAVRAACEH